MDRVLGLISLIAVLNAGFVNTETGWEYQQSTFQGFYMLESTLVDGVEVESDDVIGAFKNGECVGWVYASPDGFTTIPLMGNDGGFPNYMSNGDTAELFIYDATHGSILPIDVSGTSYDSDGDFVDDFFGELPGWSNNEIFILNGASSSNNTFGCSDSGACNYDENVTADDGSCWTANDGCDCSDGEGSEVDCAGTCNGILELDDCGVCDGGNADKDCAGECFGDNLEDGCGVCDNDSSNDDLTCTGCTDECADNFDSNNLFDDGSCEYTIPAIQGLDATSGPARVVLSWEAPESCGPSLSYEVYDVDGALIKETENTTTQILGLTPTVEYCFQVVASNENGSSEGSEFACAIPEIAGGISWGLQVSASINGWGMFEESDEFNYLGFAPNGSNDYDGGLDLPEPPINSSSNYISLYFTHDEWGSVFGNHFTQDVRLEDEEYTNSNLVVWEADVLSNMSGAASITIEHFNAPPAVPIYAEFDGQVFAVEDGSSVNFFLQEGIPQTITISIGNVVSEAPANLNIEGGDRSISLDWDDDNGLYPATSYNVYRDGELVANVSESNYFDNEDMEGHDGQGLLYESSYNYTVTGVNGAGESTDGHQVSNHDGTAADVAGRQSNGSARTDDNLDPVVVLAHAECWDFAVEDFCDGSDGSYSPVHDGSPNENRNDISVDGEGSYDSDEYDEIDRYSWSVQSSAVVHDTEQTAQTSASLYEFTTENVNGSDTNIYTLTLTVESDYPVKGGAATRSASGSIDAFLAEEPNDSPVAPLPFDIIVSGDGLATYILEDSDGNDYDSGRSLWVVPHDGTYDTDEANLIFTAETSSDPEGDELSYQWETGLDNEPFTDLNGDGTWSVNEPYDDIDGDGQWDDGDVFYNGVNLDIDRKSGDYTFNLIVTDAYGASSSSQIVVGVEAEHNDFPIVEAGENQEWFMPNDLAEKDIVVSDNSGLDSDGDSLTFTWSIEGNDLDSGSEIIDLVQSLEEGSYLFTFTVTDSYGDSASDDVFISILDEPASAAVTNLSSSHGLYYAELTFDEGVLEEDDRYTGSLDNSVGYDIFRDGELLVTLDDDGGSSFSYLDNGINPSTTYSYSVRSFNSDNRNGDSRNTSATTGDRPTVEVISPNGAEIWSVGDGYPVEVVTTDKQYIDNIEVFYSSDGGETWVSSGEIDSDSESTEISSNGSGINYDARVKVVVTDVGDFNGEDKGSKEDASDHSFTMAAHTLSKSFSDGWHLFGSPLTPFLETMDDNLGILGSWGESWIAYDQDGMFFDLFLTLGQGYYLALAQSGTLLIEGDPVVSSDFSLGDLDLQKGWTLKSNPLVNIVDKSALEVVFEGESKSWEEAVILGWIAPHIIGWFEDTHYPSEQLVPFNGYWFHTSRDLTVKVRPHLPLDASSRLIEDNMVSINLSASALDGLSGSDFITMSLKEGASDSFTYGEDEYDHPNPMLDSFIDLYLDKSEWVGTRDHRGILAESRYFAHDTRSLELDNQVWKVEGELYNVTGEIELTWSISDMNQEVHILVDDKVYDMQEVSSVTVSSLDNILVVAGDLNAYYAPTEFALSAAYPNPFNPSTTMDLNLNESGYVSVKIYNVMGQLVSTLIEQDMSAGYHTINWNASDMSSGMYLVRVHAGENMETQKIMLIK